MKDLSSSTESFGSYEDTLSSVADNYHSLLRLFEADLAHGLGNSCSSHIYKKKVLAFPEELKSNKVGKPTAYVMPEDTNPNRIPRQEKKKRKEKILILSAATENKS
ncbi:hypothetical protein NC651_028168 [Populus alba x Populus x berolinensis]|nr:hypothetical protein NC651_028168 [Populus alba x Populus x berolinensis]